MKKFLKLALLCLMSCLMLASVCSFAACSPGSSNSGAWTVVVLKPDGSAYEGVDVQLCTSTYDFDGRGTCFLPVRTDANGKAVCKPAASTLNQLKDEGINTTDLVIHLIFPKDVPDGFYTYNNERGLLVKRGETVTIKLEEA